MDVRKLLFNIVGVALGGGLMYALIKKSGYERSAKTLSATLVEGGAITGGVLLGYHLSNFAAAHLLQDSGVEKLPAQQVDSLPSGDTPVETPTADTAMGNVKAKANAVNTARPVTPEEVRMGDVIDITKAKHNGLEA